MKLKVIFYTPPEIEKAMPELLKKWSSIEKSSKDYKTIKKLHSQLQKALKSCLKNGNSNLIDLINANTNFFNFKVIVERASKGKLTYYDKELFFEHLRHNRTFFGTP